MAESNTELTLAETNFQKNQLEEAEVICRKLLQESERNIRAMILMGRIMLRRYRVDEGIQYLEKAVEADPKYILAYKLLGEVYYNKGELDKAVNQFKKILEIDPLDIDAHKKVQELSPKVPVSNIQEPAVSPVQEVQAAPPAEIKGPEEKVVPVVSVSGGPVPGAVLATAPTAPTVQVPPAPEVKPVPIEKPPAKVDEPPVISVPSPADMVTAAPASPVSANAVSATPVSQVPPVPAAPPAAPISTVGAGVKPPEEKTVAAPKPVSQQDAMELLKGRVVPLPPKAKTVIDKNLSEIKEIPGVIGSILINKDGLTTGSSLTQNAELDKELVGALSLSIYKATRNAVNTLNQGSLNQITLQTKDRIITIFNSEEFILTTIMQKNANLGLVRLENGRSIKRITEHFLTEKE